MNEGALSSLIGPRSLLPQHIATSVYSAFNLSSGDLEPDTSKLSRMYAELSVAHRHPTSSPSTRTLVHGSMLLGGGEEEEEEEEMDDELDYDEEAPETNQVGELSNSSSEYRAPSATRPLMQRSPGSSPTLSLSGSSDGYHLLSSSEDPEDVDHSTSTAEHRSDLMDEEADGDAEWQPLLSPQLRYAASRSDLHASATLSREVCAVPLPSRLSLMQPLLQSPSMGGDVAGRMLQTDRLVSCGVSQPTTELQHRFPPAPRRDWTREFEEALAQPLAQRGPIVEQLSEEFVAVAKRVGKQIIRERNLPLHLKTIRPMCQNMGIAGGEKFKHNGIFFKYAIDTNGLYGGDAFAMKVAEHELKGLTAYASCGMILGLNFGLMCLIDYRGYRLIAVSELPIEASTLIYGSADGGCTIHADVEEMNDLMERCARLLNLKGHYTGLGDSKTLLHGPADCEGHLGHDGRFYLIDLARVYPPETPDKSRPGSFLYRLLRPELVSRFHTPLSSDAFTAFGRDDHHEHDEEVRNATTWLREQLIPEFAQWLANRFVFLRSPAQPSTRDIMVLLGELHRAGINVRYLNAVRQRVRSAAVRRLIITEMCARTLKNLARAHMRAVQTSDDHAFAVLLVRFFNSTLADDTAARLRWRTDVEPLLCSEFGLSAAESAHAFDEVHRPLLYGRLQELVGVRFLPLWESGQRSPLPLRMDHLAEVYVREKRMYAISRVEADSALERARQVQGADRAEYLQLAMDKYRAVLHLKPSDYVCLSNLGQVMVDLAAHHSGEERERLMRVAFQKFESSLRINPDDYRTLTAWARGLFQCARHLLESAEHRQAQHRVHGLDAFSPSAIAEKSTFTHALALFTQAHQLCERAYCLKPQNYETLTSWGDTLLAQANLEMDMGRPIRDATDKLHHALQLFTQSVVTHPASEPLELAHIRRGSCFLLLSRAEGSSQQSELLAHAEREFREANRIRHGCARYHLAKLACIADNVRECVQHLRLAADSGLLPSSVATALSDLHPLSTSPGFASVIERLIQQQNQQHRQHQQHQQHQQPSLR